MLPEDVAPRLAAFQAQYFARIDGARAAFSDGADRGIDLVARMVSARLHEALRKEFPCLAAVLGTDAFERVAVAYLARCPSEHPSLHNVGARLATFLEGQTLIPLRSDLLDLARLEWARVEVLAAADDSPLEREALARWPLERSSFAVLRAVRAFRMVRTRFAAEDSWLAGDRGHSLPPRRKRPGALFVWRRDCVVLHRRASETELVACERLLRGASLADLCGDLAAGAPTAEAATTAFRALEQWIADGFVMVSSIAIGPNHRPPKPRPTLPARPRKGRAMTWEPVDPSRTARRRIKRV